MTPLIFLGQSFASEEDFRRAFPAYGNYVKLVKAGADTPQKVETELHRQSKGLRNGLRRGAVKYRKKRA